MWKIEVAKAVQEKMKRKALNRRRIRGRGRVKAAGESRQGPSRHHPEQKGSKSGNVRTVNSTS